MDVAYTEFDGRAIWRLGQPEIKVLTVLARFQEEDVVAGVEIGEGIQSGVVIV